jgi:hypothetical protein
MHASPGRQNPHTLSNRDRISLNADGLICSRKPRLDPQDWQQQPRRFSRMALHEFPLKSHPKSIFAVFSAITSRNGHQFSSLADLANDIAAAIRDRQTVLDGQGKLSL